MEKESAPAERLSLAEEQRRAFEADRKRDRKRERKPILSLRWSGLLLRN